MAKVIVNGEEFELGSGASNLMYFMTKEVARSGFEDFIENIGCDDDDWDELKAVISALGLKTYL